MLIFQLNVLHVMSFMVERLGPMVEPYFDSLLQYLPKLWTDSDDHHMLRCAIISTLTQIVRVSNLILIYLYYFRYSCYMLPTGADVVYTVILYVNCNFG